MCYGTERSNPRVAFDIRQFLEIVQGISNFLAVFWSQLLLKHGASLKVDQQFPIREMFGHAGP